RAAAEERRRSRDPDRIGSRRRLPGGSGAREWRRLGGRVRQIQRWINDAIVALLNLERRIDPYFRDAFDRVFQRPLVSLTQADIKDNGILSIGIKLMGVDGPKLIEDEKWTQDFTGISAPTFTTPNIRENLKLQRALLAGWPILYFVKHLRDAVMQGLYARTQS